jgi:hypothetical protein
MAVLGEPRVHRARNRIEEEQRGSRLGRSRTGLEVGFDRRDRGPELGAAHTETGLKDNRCSVYL